MASASQCLASLARLSIAPASRPLSSSFASRFLTPSFSQVRYKTESKSSKAEKKKKQHKNFRVWRKADLVTYSLCDAIRFARAFEVGQRPSSVKYDLAIKLATPKRGHIIRGRIRLPHALSSAIKIAVICPEGGQVARDALANGAVAAGDESVLRTIKDGNYTFNKLLCHPDSLLTLNKAQVGRILGPKGLMPSQKLGTVTTNIKGAMRDMAGTGDWREKEGVVRVPVGELVFTPKQLGDNIKEVVANVRTAIHTLSLTPGSSEKAIDEIVLSTTNGPGFSLSGGFSSTDPAVTPEHLSTEM